MQFFRKRPVQIAALVLAIGLPLTLVLRGGPEAGDAAITVAATRGTFVATVNTSGELRAREAVQITLPANAQRAGAYQMRISSLVPEGTIVDSGTVVAEIDRSTLAARVTELQLAIEKAEAQYEQAMLDSALTLSTARESIRNLELALEEARLSREQAVYEAPTVRRQADISYERAERQLAQARSDYQTRTEQAQAKMREVGADVQRQRNTFGIVQEVLTGFTIRAPAPGMVIYVREWNGRKRTSGSQVTSWDPSVATLPDLTQMESVTYVNEIDVRRLGVGQPVRITLDADPEKVLTGTVASVANVGEQRPNSDAKVFEVKVTVAGVDTTLRPGMTTGNGIETLRVEDALSVPLEALHGDGEIAYVFLQSGGSVRKQEVISGAVNDNRVVILKGLDEDDTVLLSMPPNPDNLDLVRLPEGDRPVSTGGDTARSVPVTGADSATSGH